MEKELSWRSRSIIATVPKGGKLSGGFNLVRYRRPMVTSLSPEHTADGASGPLDGKTPRRRSAGAAACISQAFHLALGYPADYPASLVSLADFNAGRRHCNAAFQSAVSRVRDMLMAI